MVQIAEEGRASNLKAAGTIFIGVVGAGVLGLPYAFAQAGFCLQNALTQCHRTAIRVPSYGLGSVMLRCASRSAGVPSWCRLNHRGKG